MAIPHPASQENEGRGNCCRSHATHTRLGGHSAERGRRWTRKSVADFEREKAGGRGAGSLLIHFIGFGCVGLEYFLMGAALRDPNCSRSQKGLQSVKSGLQTPCCLMV